MEDGLVRAKPPRPKLAISKAMVLGAGTCIALLITLAIFARQPAPAAKAIPVSLGKATPGSDVVMLPSAYSDLPPPRVLSPAKIEQDSDELSAFKKYLEQVAVQKHKRALDARSSSVSFQGVSISQQGNASSVGAVALESRPDGADPDAAQSPRDEFNRQDDKERFLRTRRNSDVYLHQSTIQPVSSYQLMAGTLIPGLLLTGLNSDLPGQIMGQVSQNVYDTVSGKHLLVPQGTKVIGAYDSRVVYGQDRVLIVWTRLIFPDGKSISLEGMPGVDLSGYAGVSDQVNNHYLRLLTGVVFSSVLGATAQIAEGRNYTTVNPDYGELAIQGVARNANEVGQEITRRNLNVQPTLEIRPGFRFNVFVNRDIVLEPHP